MKTNSIIALILSISLFGLLAAQINMKLIMKHLSKLNLQMSIRTIEYH